MQNIVIVILLVFVLCLDAIHAKCVYSPISNDYYDNSIEDQLDVYRSNDKLSQDQELWNKPVDIRKRDTEENIETEKAVENDDLSRLPFNLESLKKEATNFVNAFKPVMPLLPQGPPQEIEVKPQGIMTNIGLSPPIQQFLDNPLLKVPLEREGLKLTDTLLPLPMLVKNPEITKLEVLPITELPKEPPILIYGEIPPPEEDKPPVPEEQPEIGDKLPIIAPPEDIPIVLPEEAHPVIIPPEDIPQGIIVPLEEGPVLIPPEIPVPNAEVIGEPIPPPPPPPLPPPLPIPVEVDPVKVLLPILEEPALKPPEVLGPIAKGTRWALYFGNMFLSALSQVFVSAQTTLAKFANIASS